MFSGQKRVIFCSQEVEESNLILLIGLGYISAMKIETKK